MMILLLLCKKKDHLEVNQPITNLIVLNDSYGSDGGSVEDGGEPFSSHPFENADDSSKRGERDELW